MITLIHSRTGAKVGLRDGDRVGARVGLRDGDSVGAKVGSRVGFYTQNICEQEVNANQ